ncbi:unnamed protein product [Paramecium primaurelia]|uniref:Uncharacterized protein n=2 Tax=Paramecium TaxID=5884 RepID=A0A8S1UST0_9CILI|nr:unnamed protein product [Paramecium primaurelia]CAD8167257.1 unnamed protein product [Paramecium pentaurelia]
MLRPRYISYSSNITQGGLQAIQQSVNQDQFRNGSSTKQLAQKFVPFIKERDSMNRLVTKLQSISPERTERKSSCGAVNYSKEKWKQNSQVRIKSPTKKVLIQNEISLSKQRSFSNVDNKLKLIQAYTDRLHINQDESIQQINMNQDDINFQLQMNNQENMKVNTQRSPIKIKVVKQDSLHSDILNKKIQHQNSEKLKLYNQLVEKQKLNYNGEIRRSDIKLPALLFKQYMKEILDGNQKIKEVINSQDEIKYEFPPEFEQKIIQMKKDVRKMKNKLKNWEKDRRTSEDLRHLKEVADSIIQRNE